MIDLITLDSSKADEWNAFVERNRCASAYHLWEWGEVLSSTYKYQRYYMATTKNDTLTGIIPLIHVKSKLFGSRLISLPFCEYGGLLIDDTLGGQEKRESADALLEATHTIARNLGAEYVEIRNPEASFTRDSPHVAGYSNLQRYLTFRVDLTKGSEELWRNLRKSTRNATRKAMKSQVEMEEVTRADQLKAYFKLYLETQKRHGSPPHSYRLFKRLHEVFHQDKLRMLLASYQREPIGGIMVFIHNKTIFWWNNVTDAKHRNLNPTNLLLWNTAEWGIKEGYRFLDLGRTRGGTTMYFFKNGWGGQEISLQDNVYFLNSKGKELPDPTQREYEFLSRIWAFMPIDLAEKIGPRIISGIAL
jgi:FemAB-related protein (PEP-CTERM system-associated)